MCVSGARSTLRIDTLPPQVMCACVVPDMMGRLCVEDIVAVVRRGLYRKASEPSF